MKKFMLVGNFKMNLTDWEYAAYFQAFQPQCVETEVAMLPTVLSIATAVANRTSANIHIGAQDVSDQDKGAYTGQVSATQIASVGGEYALIGHSEIREYVRDGDEYYARKIRQCLQADITPIVCLQEYLTNDFPNFESKFYDQLSALLFDLSAEDFSKTRIVYEPVWAMGTGKTCSPQEAQARCIYIREMIGQKFGREISDRAVILYGGSVNGNNAQDLLAQPDINGFAVGGATISVAKMLEIADSCP